MGLQVFGEPLLATQGDGVGSLLMFSAQERRERPLVSGELVASGMDLLSRVGGGPASEEAIWLGDESVAGHLLLVRSRDRSLPGSLVAGLTAR